MDIIILFQKIDLSIFLSKKSKPNPNIHNMSGISHFIHYHVLRKMCESHIDQPNNAGIVSLKDIIDYHRSKPDIEMGLKTNKNISQKTPTKQPQQNRIDCII